MGQDGQGTGFRSPLISRNFIVIGVKSGAEIKGEGGQDACVCDSYFPSPTPPHHYFSDMPHLLEEVEGELK